MPTDNENLHYDEDTLKKVYEGLLAAGIFGQQAVDAVNQMQNQGILFRESPKKRRGRPAGSRNKVKGAPEGPTGDSSTDDAWKPADTPPPAAPVSN